MKKQLLLISSAALLASSCSNELLEESPSNATPSKGITFSVVEDEATRGMVTNEFKSFFFAEQDRVSIYADKVKKGLTTPATVSNYASAATYKATKSAGSPWLAGVDDANILTFDPSLYTATTTPSFFVVYPAAATVNYTGGKFEITPAATLATQGTTGSTMNFDSRLLYQYIEQKPANSWNSVGESMNVQLNLKSPLSMLYFNVNDIANYSEFGNLTSITLDATGAYWMNGTTVNSVAASPLSYAADGKFVAKKDNTIEYVKGASAEGTTITLSVGAAITNNTKVNMFVLPKNPVRNIGGNKTVTDKYTITYTFANVDLVYDKKESNGVWAANAAYGMPSASGLNIAETYPWILTRGSSGADRTLYVNSGNVKDIAKDASNIKWKDTRATTGVVPYTEVKKIVIAANVNDLTDEDWAILRKCVNATSLTINNKTATFKTIQQLTNMEEVIAPNVTTVEQDAFKNLGTKITTLNLQSVTSYKDTNTTFTVLEDLNMASYPFNDVNEDVVTKFFNNSVQRTLVKCNIASVTALSPVFGYSRNILFTGYTLLEEITLNATKTTIAASEFKDCTSLKTVNGVLEMSTANNAFENAGTSAGLTVNMFGTDIPDAAFKESKVNVIRHNGAAIQPTTIGKNAFDNNTKIESLDLSKTTSFGVSAFAGATNFVGVTKTGANLNNNGVVTLIATSIPANAFNGTKIIRFQLKNATTVYAGALASSALQQIKFRQNVSAWNNTNSTGIQSGFAGARATYTDLFVKSLIDLAAFSDTFGTRTVDDTDWE